MQDNYTIEYVINNIEQFSKSELLQFDFCKILDTPRYKNKDIIVFNNGELYNSKTCNFIKKSRKDGKTYTIIQRYNEVTDTYTAMIVPYIICSLFRNDNLKHEKNAYNVFEYFDGNCDNCSWDNIRANYYEYKVIEQLQNDVVKVDICGYEVLLNNDFYLSELNKYKFNVRPNYSLIYFYTETLGRNESLHHLVMKYYSDIVITGVIDHINHNTLDNRIENLHHINHIINSMNSFNIHPIWYEEKQCWKVKHRIDKQTLFKSFSIYKYGTKEHAYDEAMKYINDYIITNKIRYLEEKEKKLKIAELDQLIKYFKDNNMLEQLLLVLQENDICGDCCK